MSNPISVVVVEKTTDDFYSTHVKGIVNDILTICKAVFYSNFLYFFTFLSSKDLCKHFGILLSAHQIHISYHHLDLVFTVVLSSCVLFSSTIISRRSRNHR